MIELLEFRKYLLDNKNKSFEFKPYGGNFVWFEGFLSRKLKKKITVSILNCAFDKDWNPHELPKWAELFNFKVSEHAEDRLKADETSAWEARNEVITYCSECRRIKSIKDASYPDIPTTVKLKGSYLLKILAEVFIECDAI